MNIELNIFTNSTKSAPSTRLIEKTYASFCDTFTVLESTVWCDINPNTAKFNLYFNKLGRLFKTVIQTMSFSEGYIKAIKRSEADYLFMLEHDWVFTDQVCHGLAEIVEVMKNNQIYHFRFNKRANIVAVWDKWLEEKDGGLFKYCETACLSNNPHIIDRKRYMTDLIKKLKIKQGSRGIEEYITHRGYVGAIYGPLDYEAAVVHLDGRNNAN
jgi:hypothetical protein